RGLPQEHEDRREDRGERSANMRGPPGSGAEAVSVPHLPLCSRPLRPIGLLSFLCSGGERGEEPARDLERVRVAVGVRRRRVPALRREEAAHPPAAARPSAHAIALIRTPCRRALDRLAQAGSRERTFCSVCPPWNHRSRPWRIAPL